MVSVAAASLTPALAATPTIHRSKMIPSSPVSILKSSKLVSNKRKMDDADLTLSPASVAAEGLPELPAKKRARVTFNDKNSIREFSVAENAVLASSTGKGVAVIREEVRRAIHRHVTMGESEAYDQIKEIFVVDPRKADSTMQSWYLPSHETIKNHLMGLLSHIASLDRNCSGLVHAVLNSEWLGRDEAYMKLYIRFLGNLAAAQGTYLVPVLRMLTGKLAGVPRGTGSLPGYPLVQPTEIYSRVHLALRHILRLIPAGSGTLSPVLVQQFPPDPDSAKCFLAYTRNLIEIITYAPELQSDILALITERLVKIDVQIQVDLEDVEDEFGEDFLLEGPPDPEEELDDSDSDISDDEGEDDRRSSEIKSNIHKVDGIIDILFEFFSDSFQTASGEDRKNILALLMSYFRSIILPTYKSRHSQFLLFHFSQASPELVDVFTTECMEIISSKTQSSLTRQSAAAYLASYVARGAHIPGAVVRDVFDILLTHLTALQADYEPNCRGPDLRRFSPFYSTAQAVFYIFCFRWRDLTTAAANGDTAEQIDELEDGHVTFPPNIKECLHKAIYSRLNPLKICSPSIVTQFARIVQHFEFLWVNSLLESNKRLRVTAFRSIATLANAQVAREIRASDHLGYQLDAYFPFDPYHLPRSRRWLEGDYVEWRGIPGLDDGGDSDSEAEDNEGEGDDATATDEE
ncbi:uncharacterized protein N7483_009806 [Penicillium malachiteum]|uniref:uncharacterized protein n=1 Tax=Penicillium malachiteum TaxID=1324776 RepID=UPI0025469B03|nr:uncharacterized protein N7483_009806 [Penicillium malachiteum]KAJ5721872.1 hypothetical protein N7483_009806 [Penicillium malachiteum]